MEYKLAIMNEELDVLGKVNISVIKDVDHNSYIFEDADNIIGANDYMSKVRKIISKSKQEKLTLMVTRWNSENVFVKKGRVSELQDDIMHIILEEYMIRDLPVLTNMNTF